MLGFCFSQRAAVFRLFRSALSRHPLSSVDNSERLLHRRYPLQDLLHPSWRRVIMPASRLLGATRGSEPYVGPAPAYGRSSA